MDANILSAECGIRSSTIRFSLLFDFPGLQRFGVAASNLHWQPAAMRYVMKQMVLCLGDILASTVVIDMVCHGDRQHR
jgi:hypothetical protein